MTFSTFAELAAFLMVYVAKTDGQAHFLEEATVAEKLRSFTEDSESLLQEITQANPKIAEVKIETILKENEEILRASSSEDKLNLIQSLFAIVNSDGKVQAEETLALRTIRAAVEAAS